jgi:hypothetical protein
VHRELLLQVTDLLLEAFDLESWVEHRVDCCLIGNLHHATCEFESGGSLTQVSQLWPDVGDHDRFTIAADGVSEEVSQLGLSVWDVAALLV